MRRELANIPTTMAVVAVALCRRDGRWLMHRRPPEKHHGGLWEFPGGKVEPGETRRAALVREVNEELGLRLDPTRLRPAASARSAAGGGRPGIVIELYTAEPPPGSPRALEGGEIGWFTPAEALALPMPPLDVALAGQLFGAPG